MTAENGSALFHFAQVTPVGRSAIASLVVNGVPALSVVDQFFQPLGRTPFSAYPIRRIVFGKWRHSDGTYEELVIARTTESEIEIHCHGGVSAIEAVANTLRQHGGQLMSWQELEQLRFEGELPYWKKAEQLLPHTTTMLATKIAMQHAGGEIEQLLEKAEQLQQQSEFSQAKNLLTAYCQTSRYGKHLIEPWTVVIAGRPNAGKSSLINQLVGYERAIVNQQAGTTRDLLRAPTVIEGWPVEFIDTAGLRDGDDAIEIAGIELAKSQLAQADLVLWVHDLSTPWEEEIQQELDEFPVLFIGNKSDLVTNSQFTSAWNHTRVSAQSGAGIDQLLLAIIATLVPNFDTDDLKVLFCNEMDQRIRDWVSTLPADHEN